MNKGGSAQLRGVNRAGTQQSYRQMPRILGLEQGIALELELDVEEELGPVKD